MTEQVSCIIFLTVDSPHLKASAIDNIWSPVDKYLQKNTLDIWIKQDTIKHL